MISPPVERGAVLSEAELHANAVDVGRRFAEKAFGQIVFQSIDPDEIDVALGQVLGEVYVGARARRYSSEIAERFVDIALAAFEARARDLSDRYAFTGGRR